MCIRDSHFDAAYAAKTEWKKPLVDSTLTLALLTGMSVRTVSAKVVANLGWDKVKATHPVFAGDTLCLLYTSNTLLDPLPMLLFQPVIQYYANVGGGVERAVVFGFRTKVEF